MARARNPRRVVAELLDYEKQVINWMRLDWVAVRRDVYVPCPAGENPTGWAYYRPRRLDEYPENSPEKWADLARWAGTLAEHATFLADMADRKARELKESQEGNE